MRPSMGGNALSTQSSKQSFDEPDVTTPLPIPGNAVPTTFFMASESMLERSDLNAALSGSKSNFGVRSLEETLEEEEARHDGDEHESSQDKLNARRRSTLKARLHELRDRSSDSLGQLSATSKTGSSPPRSRQRRQASDGPSQPLTPISYASPVPGSSLPSSPKSTSTRSFRPSDEDSADDAGSQAIASSGDEDAEVSPAVQTGAVQLIMPSIMMPSRRPFTERGKDLGKLKVLLAGASGTGKTSLIRSIVQTCEDIVHVDPLSSHPPSLQSSSVRKGKGKSDIASSNSTKNVTEVYASTKAYPSWWSDLEDSKILRRRKSTGETVLERNLCFVDTPGFDADTCIMESMEPVHQYIEHQVSKSTDLATMADGDLLCILAGNGGTQVDLVLYLIKKGLRPSDIDFMKRLSLLTNIIPLLAKSDSLSDDEAETSRLSLSNELEAAGLKPFAFGSGSSIYTVCSSPSDDRDNMDASLLMSPDYVQPLFPSELDLLVSRIFSKDNQTYLRHSAAKKIIQWRRTSHRLTINPSAATPLPPHLPRYNTSPSGTSSIPTLSSTTTSLALMSHPNSPSYSHAKLADHTQREERLAQIHLANWAANLQRSLQNERARYEALARGERAIWLTERLGECVSEGQLMPARQLEATAAGRDGRSVKAGSVEASLRRKWADPMDPLGLMRWNEILRQTGWIAVKVAGLGAVGAAVVWFLRTWSENWMGDGFGGWEYDWRSWVWGE